MTVQPHEYYTIFDMISSGFSKQSVAEGLKIDLVDIEILICMLQDPQAPQFAQLDFIEVYAAALGSGFITLNME